MASLHGADPLHEEYCEVRDIFLSFVEEHKERLAAVGEETSLDTLCTLRHDIHRTTTDLNDILLEFHDVRRRVGSLVANTSSPKGVYYERLLLGYIDEVLGWFNPLYRDSMQQGLLIRKEIGARKGHEEPRRYVATASTARSNL